MLEDLTLPDEERANPIERLYADPRSRGFAELLIDAEEDPAASKGGSGRDAAGDG